MPLPDGTYDILKCVPLNDFKTVLDLGMGTGKASQYFLSHKKRVIASTYDLESFKKKDNQRYRSKLRGIELIACNAETLPFANQSIEAVWASHIIEHTRNVGLALDEINRILKPNGWFFVAVPPHKTEIVGGHISVGWNIGQLLYTLINAKFNVREGHFVRHKYNIVAFVRKQAPFVLPKLIFAAEDILQLSKSGLLPDGLMLYKSKKGIPFFEGDIKAINWPPPWISNSTFKTTNGANSSKNLFRKLYKKCENLLCSRF
jgi:SAM-dependent methyltransferase